MTLHRSLFGAIALAAALVITASDASAFDESKYPAFQGQWKRKLGTVNAWDESKRPGLPQDPPLTPEYRKLWEASMADQKEGGQGLDTRVTCISNGMPRMMTILRQLEIFITPWVTLVVFENNLPRRIYTDGRDWTAKDNLPSYNGYSIGKWIDEDDDGKYDVLEIETRHLKHPRAYDASGAPLHFDAKTIVKERIYLDKANPNVLHDDITVYDDALVRPRVSNKRYDRELRPLVWVEAICPEGNPYVQVEGEIYMRAADGKLMPAKKGQRPPDLQHFTEGANK